LKNIDKFYTYYQKTAIINMNQKPKQKKKNEVTQKRGVVLYAVLPSQGGFS
jgi:hypothetical protein